MMLSKNKVSEITKLHQKKHRQNSGLFIAEGEKIIDEILASQWEIIELYTTADLYEKYLKIYPQVQLAEPHLFAKISTLKTPAGVLAVVKQHTLSIDDIPIKNRFTLCLDGLRDPGNLGTIIRIADWFGIKNIICSEDTVDLYNSKTIQATMGSFLRVQVMFGNLNTFLKNAQQQHVPVFGAVLNGENIYKKSGVKQGIIVMGSESHGISADVLTCVDTPVTIPSKLLQFSSDQQENNIDSLNVAIATSVICAVLARY